MLHALKRIDRKAFFLLLAAGLVACLAVLPFAFDLIKNLPIDRAAAPELPMPLVIGLSLLQNGVFLAVAIAVGMVLSERVGLRMPLIRAWSTGATPPNPGTIVIPGIVVGAVVGALLVGIEMVFFLRHLPAAMHQALEIPLWKRLLAGVAYGGIAEELLMRLFLLSLVAWLLGKWWKTADSLPTTGAFWVAIVVVAVLFGLGHLPATAAITPLTDALVARALVLNGVAGMAFGYLYWRHGLESAMLGHMSAHVVLQVPGVTLLRSLQ